MNEFGGKWTFDKIQIVEDYALAYLQIMKNHPYWKLLYFDGFAGSGEIKIEGKLDGETIDGAARRILNIEAPRLFDIYYFVELNKKKADALRHSIQKIKDSGVFVVSDNCNKKLLDLAAFLKGETGKGGKEYRVLAFIDPCGMAVDWKSIEALRNLPIDLWILVPTGIGVNRLLTHDPEIPESWLKKLETFFGIDRNLLLKCFYQEITTVDLFAQETRTYKMPDAINKIRDLYTKQIAKVFEYVSSPYVMANSSNSIMFHFVLASNNKTAVKIANDIINKKAGN